VFFLPKNIELLDDALDKEYELREARRESHTNFQADVLLIRTEKQSDSRLIVIFPEKLGKIFAVFKREVDEKMGKLFVELRAQYDSHLKRKKVREEKVVEGIETENHNSFSRPDFGSASQTFNYLLAIKLKVTGIKIFSFNSFSTDLRLQKPTHTTPRLAFLDTKR